MFANIIKSGLARRVVGHALGDDPDYGWTTDQRITEAIEGFGSVIAYLKLNLEDEACFDYGSAGECAQPGPAHFDQLTKEERLMWLGDYEPLMQWLVRL